MKLNQVALQLYTLRNYLDKPEKIPVTLKRVREIGYQAVQLSGACALPAKEMKKMMDDAGLVCFSTHEDPTKILNEPKAVADYLNELGATSTAYPYPGNVTLETLADAKDLAKRLDKSGEALRKAGIILTYHNHHIEFQKVDGQLILDVLYNESKSENLQGEIDTYWVQYGGGNPVEWCQKLKNRLPLLHMKDFRINKKREIEFAEIGYGNLNWKQILPAAEASGCQWFIVEQDTCPGEPFDSIKMSFDYIQSHLVQ